MHVSCNHKSQNTSLAAQNENEHLKNILTIFSFKKINLDLWTMKLFTENKQTKPTNKTHLPF